MTSKINELLETSEMESHMDTSNMDAILEAEMDKDEAIEKAADSAKECIFEYKDEVRFKKKRVPKELKNVTNLAQGIFGRVLNVVDKDTVYVDFWQTTPARFNINVKHLALQTPAAEVALRAAPVAPEKAAIAIKRSKATKDTPLKLNAGKPRLDLIRPEFLLAIGEVLNFGAEKYDEAKDETPNYLRGEGHLYTDIIASLERHTQMFKAGINVDEESGLAHLAQIASNAMMLYTYTISKHGRDNRVILEKDDET